MARTYREIAIEEMLGTVEEAMSQVIDWWGTGAMPPQNGVGLDHAGQSDQAWP
jgi:hypothetical protein